MDTLRVLAMLGIFFHHLWLTVVPTPATPMEHVLHWPFYCGADGVIFFNVMAGFLACYPYIGPHRRPFPGWGAYLCKRFLRVVPDYYTALVLFTVANMIVFSFPFASAMRVLAEHLLFINSLNSNNIFLNISAFWYLGMLAQFYLCLPLLLRLFQRFGPVMATLAITVVCWGGCLLFSRYASAHSDPVLTAIADNLVFNLPTRLPEFAFGMWMAHLFVAQASSDEPTGVSGKVPFLIFLSAMGIYLIVGAPFAGKLSVIPFYLYHAAGSLPFFAILFYLPQTARPAQWPVIQKLSKYSFGIYIVHQPIFSYFGIMPGKIPSTIPEFLKLSLFLFPLCLAAAVLLDIMARFWMRRFSFSSPKPLPEPVSKM